MARVGQDMVNELLVAPGYTQGKLFTDEPSTIEGWAEAYTKYFEKAEAALPTPVFVTVPALRSTTPPATSNPKTDMKTAMVGLSLPGGAPAAIQAGVVAFWAALVAFPVVYFAAATAVTPPPGISVISADIVLAAPLNVAAPNDAPTSLGYLVDGGLGGNVGIHPLTVTSATATFPGPTTVPIL